MAQRIALVVLGPTLAPYSSASPPLSLGAVSETWHIDVSQLQKAKDTTAAQQVAYPHALASIDIKYVKANHFQTSTVYTTINSAAIDALAG